MKLGETATRSVRKFGFLPPLREHLAEDFGKSAAAPRDPDRDERLLTGLVDLAGISKDEHQDMFYFLAMNAIHTAWARYGIDKYSRPSGVLKKAAQAVRELNHAFDCLSEEETARIAQLLDQEDPGMGSDYKWVMWRLTDCLCWLSGLPRPNPNPEKKTARPPGSGRGKQKGAQTATTRQFNLFCKVLCLQARDCGGVFTKAGLIKAIELVSPLEREGSRMHRGGYLPPGFAPNVLPVSALKRIAEGAPKQDSTSLARARAMMADFRRAMMADFRRAVRAGHATKVDPMKAAEIRRAAVAALVTEAATGGADPVFALIEGHERVVGQKSALCARADEVDKTLPREQTTWTIRFNNEGEGRWPPQGCTDAPEWIDVQLAIGEITEKQCDLEFALLTTAPTTIEGAIALLAHLGAGEPPEERGMDGVVSLLSVAGVRYDERVRDAADAFPATLAAALRKIVAA